MSVCYQNIIEREPTISHLTESAGLFRNANPEIRRRRLLFRSWHRGTQEIDLIAGSFADRSLHDFDNSRMDRFEALLDCSDADLLDWIIGRSTPPPEHDHDVMRMLRSFHYRPKG
jgi:antitoxin CptB